MTVKQKTKKIKLIETNVWEYFVSEVYDALSNLTPRSVKDIQNKLKENKNYPQYKDIISQINKALNADLKNKTIRIAGCLAKNL